ncbi:MAG: hypothetical protein AB1696_19370 [Planctomycetota bacterium]
MLLSRLIIFLAMGGLLLAAALADDFPLSCVVDYHSPVLPELLKQAGIQRVYISIGFPVQSVEGKPALDPKVKPELEDFLRLYGQGGVKVLVASGYYAKPPKGAECVDFWGRTVEIGCFNNEKFLDWMAEQIKNIALVLREYEAFDGFMFDDGVHVRVDCCYCDTCKRLFREKHGIEPPPFEPYKGDARLAPDDPRLLWDAFHQEAYNRYLRTQAKAAQSVSDKLFLATIPSDSYFYGRQLSSDVPPAETETKSSARLQRIDRIQVRRWHIFQSFPFLKIVADGTGREPFGVGTHLTTPSPKIIMHHEGPFIEQMGRQQFLSPAEISRQMRTIIAEGASAICFWENSRAFPHYPDAFTAVGQVVADVKKVEKAMEERKPYPARIGLLYSTATEIIQQPWMKNTLERWRHLHCFEAMAYAMTRMSIQFRILFDSDLANGVPSDLDALILTGVTHLTKPVAEGVEKAIADRGLKVLTDPTCLPIKGAEVCEFDTSIWFESQLRGYRQVRHLDHQAAAIRRGVFPSLDFPKYQPVVVSSGSCFARFFQGADDSLLIFVVNWDIEEESFAKVDVPFAHTFRDESSEERLGEGNSLEVKVAPAGWRVVRCMPMK